MSAELRWLLTELAQGDGMYYLTQEAAMAPGISGDWPDVIPKPGAKHKGRLVKRRMPTEALRDVLSAVPAAPDSGPPKRPMSPAGYPPSAPHSLKDVLARNRELEAELATHRPAPLAAPREPSDEEIVEEMYRTSLAYNARFPLCPEPRRSNLLDSVRWVRKTIAALRAVPSVPPSEPGEWEQAARFMESVSDKYIGRPVRSDFAEVRDVFVPASLASVLAAIFRARSVPSVPAPPASTAHVLTGLKTLADEDKYRGAVYEICTEAARTIRALLSVPAP